MLDSLISFLLLENWAIQVGLSYGFHILLDFFYCIVGKSSCFTTFMCVLMCFVSVIVISILLLRGKSNTWWSWNSYFEDFIWMDFNVLYFFHCRLSKVPGYHEFLYFYFNLYFWLDFAFAYFPCIRVMSLLCFFFNGILLLIYMDLMIKSNYHDKDIIGLNPLSCVCFYIYFGCFEVSITDS